MTDEPRTPERIAAANARIARAFASFEALRGELDSAQADMAAAVAHPEAGDEAFTRFQVLLDRAAAHLAEVRDASLEVQLLRRKPGTLS